VALLGTSHHLDDITINQLESALLAENPFEETLRRDTVVFHSLPVVLQSSGHYSISSASFPDYDSRLI
jgi:hypothetical protein